MQFQTALKSNVVIPIFTILVILLFVVGFGLLDSIDEKRMNVMYVLFNLIKKIIIFNIKVY